MRRAVLDGEAQARDALLELAHSSTTPLISMRRRLEPVIVPHGRSSQAEPDGRRWSGCAAEPLGPASPSGACSGGGAEECYGDRRPRPGIATGSSWLRAHGAPSRRSARGARETRRRSDRGAEGAPRQCARSGDCRERTSSRGLLRGAFRRLRRELAGTASAPTAATDVQSGAVLQKCTGEGMSLKMRGRVSNSATLGASKGLSPHPSRAVTRHDWPRPSLMLRPGVLRRARSRPDAVARSPWEGERSLALRRSG